MASIFGRLKEGDREEISVADPASVLDGFSIEVMPRTALEIEDFKALLPAETRVYVAHIDGTPIEDMLATVSRLASDGFAVMPHIPARSVSNSGELESWVHRYSDAGAQEALLLGGDLSEPRGPYNSSMQLMETGLFDRFGFQRLHVAGHPEGNREIDPDGSDANVMAALKLKRAFSERTDAQMAIVTQFTFDIEPIAAWTSRLQQEGIDLPIHLGIAGPSKLHTMIKFAITCRVGPSIRMLQRRAKDVSKLLLPYEPTDLLHALATHKATDPDSLIDQVHFFPFGGITKSVEYAMRHSSP